MQCWCAVRNFSRGIAARYGIACDDVRWPITHNSDRSDLHGTSECEALSRSDQHGCRGRDRPGPTGEGNDGTGTRRDAPDASQVSWTVRGSVSVFLRLHSLQTSKFPLRARDQHYLCCGDARGTFAWGPSGEWTYEFKGNRKDFGDALTQLLPPCGSLMVHDISRKQRFCQRWQWRCKTVEEEVKNR